MINDFFNLGDIKRAISDEQRKDISKLPEEQQKLPKFKLVQMGLVRSRAEINKTIFYGDLNAP